MKKINIDKSVLRELTAQEIHRVAGGADNDSLVPCASVTCPPPPTQAQTCGGGGGGGTSLTRLPTKHAV